MLRKKRLNIIAVALLTITVLLSLTACNHKTVNFEYKINADGEKTKVKVPVLARTQMKLLEKNPNSQTLRFEMSVRDPKIDTSKVRSKEDIKLMQNV